MNKSWNDVRNTLQHILNDEVDSNLECGCQLCIIEHGKVVINLCAGTFHANDPRPITPDTLMPVFSCGKPILAALAWKMAEQGKISYDDPVAKYWHEFSVPDKCAITIEHLLSHRAGLYLLPSGNPDLSNWESMCAQTAQMQPRNAPGKKCHYHPLTYGWLLGHTLELAGGKPLKRLLQEEVLEPAGVDGKLYFGIDDTVENNIAPIDDTLCPSPMSWEAKTMNDPVIRRCCIPSFAGIGNAYGLAKFYANLRGKLVTEATFDYATGKIFRDPADQIKPSDWAIFALGVILRGPENNRRQFIGHGGAAGSEGFYMPEEDIAFAFVKNRQSPRHPDHPVRDRISDALDIPRRFW